MKLFNYFRTLARRQKIGEYVERQYAAAAGGRLTSDWMAGGSSEDTELAGSLETMRNRSRQMIRDNPHAANLQRIIEDNVVGTGIGLQCLVTGADGKPDAAINDRIEAAWAEWSDRNTCHTAGLLSLTDLLRVAVGGVFSDGEALVRIVPKAFGGGRIPFALDLIEPDLLLDQASGTFQTRQGSTVRLGVEVNEWHRPLAYWMRTTHPGDTTFLSSPAAATIRRIAADEILHMYIVKRWPQTRGVPWMHMALRKMRDMGGYTESELVAARAAANIVGFVKQGIDVCGAEGTEEILKRAREQPIVKSSPGLFQRLLPGESFEGFSPSRPNANLDPFMRYMLREVAAGVGVSYEALSRDYSQSNYSSSRLALLNERDLWRVLQGWLIRNYLTPIYRRWLDAAVLSGAVDIPDYLNNKSRYQEVRFKPRGWSWVDPAKEVQAYALAVQHGFMSRSDVIAAIGNGQDREDVDKAIQSDRERAAELGLNFDQPVKIKPEEEKKEKADE